MENDARKIDVKYKNEKSIEKIMKFHENQICENLKIEIVIRENFDVVMNIIPIYIILRGRGIGLHKPVTESWTLKSQNDADAADVRL